MTRLTVLTELIETVFMNVTTDVQGNGPDYIITSHDGFFKKNRYKYNSPTFLAKLKQLFILGFKIDGKSVKCEIKKEYSTKKDIGETLSKEDVINNSKKYFLKHEIDFNVISKYCKNDELNQLLLSAIVNYILPAAFIRIDNMPPEGDDIIDEFMMEAIRTIKIMLLDARFKHIMRSADVPYEIVDSTLISKESCNYKLTIKKTGLDLPTVPVWQPLYISFPIYGLQDYKKSSAILLKKLSMND